MQSRILYLILLTRGLLELKACIFFCFFANVIIWGVKFLFLIIFLNFQVEIEQNMNALYDGPFQRDIRNAPTKHLQIMDHSDYIFFNISEGLKAMDEIR